MQNFEENLASRVNGSLQPLLGVSVTVKTAQGLLATIYSDNGATTQGNPMETDANGRFGFYAANGDYVLTFSGPQIHTYERPIDLYDPDDAQPFTQAQAALPSAASRVGFQADGEGAQGRTIENKLREIVSATDFGSLAVIDATTVVQAAIDAVAATGGGIVSLPWSGVITVTGLVLKDRVQLQGLGKNVTTIKLKEGANNHVIQAGDFDANANGVSRATPVGCKTGGLKYLTIDGNKANQTVAKHGFAYYGIDVQLEEVEFKNAKGIGSAIESPGGTYSSVVGQNLQPSIRHIESHDNDAGNWSYNGQSDTNMYDLMLYQTGTGDGQYNARFGSKAPGCRVFGMHCWGTSDYGLINEADKIEFFGCHIESAAIAKVYAKGRTLFSGLIYEVGSNTSAPAIKIESGTGANFSEFDAVISGCLEWIAFPSTVPSLCRFKLRGWVPGAAFYSGTAPATALLDLKNQSTGIRLIQHSADYSVKSLAVTGGIDMGMSGIDRIKLIAGNGWAVVVPSAGVLNIASSFVSASSASAVDITDINSAAGQIGIMQVTIRNGNAGALTFKHNTAKLRNNGTADKVLAQHESITYMHVSGAVWQQTGGK